MTTRPTVRLRPQANARRIRHGFPWVYANELVTDRRTKALAAGSIATLEDNDRRPLATVAITPASKIICRVLDLDPNADIATDWIKARISAAYTHRERLYDTPFYRLIHAEADDLPGVVIDRFGDVAVMQPNAAWADQLQDVLADALVEVTGVTTVIKNASGRARSLEGLDEENAVLCGAAPDFIEVPMNGAIYIADMIAGQKTGLFFDQRDNHAFVKSLSQGATVLDVFSHVGGFSLAALAGGAASAVAVDGSAAALDLATRGADLAGFADRFKTRQGDAFDVMTQMQQNGLGFDVVICDPPAFAPNKNALDAGLRAYERVARLGANLIVPEGGYLTLCSCSHTATPDKFRLACVRGIGRAGRRAQLIRTGYAGPDHPQHPQLAESGYLKALTFRIF
ncbi:RSP_2647 family RNA methyltransferase [Qingshengfaniella alkalisoli]|uniref:Class I SAM-dependent rRNA methyltransferase n=1 Tax=Qingshengfaniella alkalisoli TaxID=2599296 RepID=A0A5B8I6X1_9RHOB|nr:class I SAM-dependent rRNA methyltransferase [Qingshengfaniella alkalisoli]QDY69365.1 class I SAM-dependent rRNA methyltransferase [Qingshengfaniella alkalisoli]